VGSRSGRPVFGLPRFGVVAVHRNASLIAVGLLSVHLLTLLFDPYAQLKLVNLVIPFGSVYRPLWVGLGTVAIDLLAVVLLSTWIRHHLGARTWRAVHWASYVIWPIALLHGLFSGTDGRRGWLLAIAGLCALAVAAALVWRVSDRFTETAGRRAAGMTSAAPRTGATARTGATPGSDRSR